MSISYWIGTTFPSLTDAQVVLATFGLLPVALLLTVLVYRRIL